MTTIMVAIKFAMPEAEIILTVWKLSIIVIRYFTLTSLHLWNISHVSSALKNLLSTCKLSLDNSAFVEFHPFYFLIKDKAMKKIMLRGPYYDGLYHLVPHSMGSLIHPFCITILYHNLLLFIDIFHI
jgi:hypothetical protein